MMILALLAALQMPMPAATGPATGPATGTACPARPVIPVELAGWGTGAPVTAAVDAQGIGAAMLPVGKGVGARLRPTALIAYPLAAARTPVAGSQGGLFGFVVARPGRYRVALGAGAWIDVVASGKAVASVAHGHGPDCSPVRKMVDFDLAPGRYLLQVQNSTTPTLALMIARLR